MRIMLVEDDKDLREILSGTLTRRGHQVIEACDGMQAWELFRHGVFDVVISDWTMPQMTGIELCRTLRGLARNSYTYIIILTAESGSEKMIEALDAGADDFVTKPFQLNVLGARLRVAERILRLHAHVNRLEGLLGE